MRILHVNKFLYRRGGAEAYMEDLAGLQAAAGHEVAFFGMRHPENPASPFEAWFPEYLEFGDSHPPLLTRLRLAGRMLHSRSAARGIARVADEFRPDAVHLHNIYHQLSPSILGPLHERGIPTVMTLHDYKLVCPTYRFLDHGAVCEACLGGRFFNAAVHRCKDGSLLASSLAAAESYLHAATRAYGQVGIFISPSRFLAGKLRQAGVYPDRLRHVDHFVDAAGIQPKAVPGGPLIYAGRLSDEKGVDTLVRAVGRVPEARLDVVGEGPAKPALESLAFQAAPGRVAFHGRQPRARVLEMMRSSIAAVLPARWHENQPIMILEAFASGIPVVASDLGGLPELVEPGLTGELVRPDDPAALAAALAGILADPGRACEMGRAARRMAEGRFAPAHHTGRIEELYSEAGGRRMAA